MTLQLCEVCAGLATLNVAVIGETIEDVFVLCRALSAPPGPTSVMVEIVDQSVYLGGAYPVARDLSHFCNSVKFITNYFVRPTDDSAKLSISMVGDSRVGIRITRFTEAQDVAPLLYACQWAADATWHAARDEMVCSIVKQVRGSDVVIVIDYGHGLIDERVAEAIAHESTFLAVNCQANGGIHPFNLLQKYPRMDLLAANEYEARLNLGSHNWPSAAIAARSLAAKFNAAYALVSDSAQGVWLSVGQTLLHKRSLARNIVDTIGCGDAMLGFTAAALVAQCGASAALELGALAAAAKARMRVHEREITPSLLKELARLTTNG